MTCVEGGDPKYPGGFFTSDQEVPYRRVECNKNRQSVTGGGFAADNGPDDAHVFESKPVDGLADKDKIPDDGWSVKFYNDQGGSQGVLAQRRLPLSE